MVVSSDPAIPKTRNLTRLRKVAAELRRDRHTVARALAEPLMKWEKFAAAVETMGEEAFITWETIPLVDYLISYLQDDDPNWRALFIGERLKQLHWPADTLKHLIDRREDVFLADRDALRNILRPRLAAVEMAEFTERMDRARDLVTTAARSSREVKILLVGDCLFLDISTFMAAPLLDRGITLRPVFATSKNPIELRSTLRGLTNEKFDLICYSPYSYEFSLPLLQTHYLQGIVTSSRALRRLAAEAHRQITPTLRLLSEQFDCSVFMQNTANVRRHNGTAGSYLKNFATALARKITAKEVNTLLAADVADRNAAAPKPIVLIDELELVARDGELTLGKKFYDSEPVHPTVLSLRLSAIYCDIVCASKDLMGKKVVVVDLDNTVWAGVIGEGSVVHDHARQQILKLLRQKGVLLAIASKNDPRNVNWTGGLLDESDFVSTQINWDPKANSIRRTAAELNLNVKDFIFIDDRPDEREMVSLGVPGIYCMDATSEATWRMLEWWAKALPEQNEADRTQMYMERKARQTHLDAAAEEEDQQHLLASLGLRVTIRPATQKELTRATELVNRTNQFNTCGSRVTNQQMAVWSQSDQHHVLVADASDKFGSMGIISVMVIEQLQDVFQISVWVLSCRVFGFGIENAMLNQARRIGERLGVSAIRGQIVETPNNQPCREVYANNRFTLVEGAWESRNTETLADPEWLAVTVAG